MERETLLNELDELGYKEQRRAKHCTLFKHPITQEVVGVANTPSDRRAYQQCLADAKRGAVTNGKGHLRLSEEIQDGATLGEAGIQVLKASSVPMRTGEVAEAVMRKMNCPLDSARPELAKRAKREPGVVRLARGWYVYDPELAELPDEEREFAIREIGSFGYRNVYRNGLRGRILESAKSGVKLEPAAVLCEPKKTNTGEATGQTDTVPQETTEAPVEPEEVAAPKPVDIPPMFELLSEDPDGFVVLKDDGGRHWIARRLTMGG